MQILKSICRTHFHLKRETGSRAEEAVTVHCLLTIISKNFQVDIDMTRMSCFLYEKAEKEETGESKNDKKVNQIFPMAKNSRMSHTRAVMLMDNYKVDDYLSKYFILGIIIIVSLILLATMIQHASSGMKHPRFANPELYWMTKFPDYFPNVTDKDVTGQTSSC